MRQTAEADLLQAEAEGQQVGTDSQAELQQETAQEVVLSLVERFTNRHKVSSIHQAHHQHVAS